MSGFEKFCAVFCLVVGVILTGGFSYKIGHRIGYRAGYRDGQSDIQHDTTIVVDTVREYYPVEKYKYIDRPVYIPVTDTMFVHENDTTYITLPMEVKGYSDEDYKLEIEGVSPTLRWIEVYPKTITITNTIIDKKRWSFSIAGGPGVVWNQNGFHGGIGAVAGISYNF